MSLDMYALKTLQTPVADADFTTVDGVEFHYWRNHPDLHGWMQELYDAKGGSSITFSGDAVVLTEQDLDDLERDLRTNRLPVTCGPSFGTSDGSERDGDFEFIADARAAIADGYAVYYFGDW